MAKRKSKPNPRKSNSKKEDDKKKEITTKKSPPRQIQSVDMKFKASEDNNIPGILSNRRRTRSSLGNPGPSESVEQRKSKENEQSGQASSLYVDKQIGEQTNDIAEFARAIVRLQRETQLEMNNHYGDLYDGEEGDFSDQDGEGFSDQDEDYLPDDANADVEANEIETFMGSDQHLTEAYLEDNLEALPESPSGTKKRKSRGPTTLPHLNGTSTRNRKVVEYNENGQPIGRVAVELASYMGVLARQLVPITHQKWKKVPEAIIEQLWSCLEQRFLVDPKSRKRLISGIGDKWRCFKSNLTRLYILPFKDQVELLVHPPRKYGFIKQEDWDAFVRSRLSDTFQALHKAQSERRGQYLYPHRLSRKGYASLAEDLKKSGEIAPEEMDRSILWKKARQDKKGEYINDATREKALIIDDLKSHLTEKTPVSDLKSDVLTLALGTPERNGRVRGVGKFITPSSFFHTPRSGSLKHIEQLNEERKLIEEKWQKERVSRVKIQDTLRTTQDRVAQLEKQLGRINQGNPPPLIGEKVCLPPLNTENVCSNTIGSPDNDHGESIDDEMSPPDPTSMHGKSKPSKLIACSISKINANNKIFFSEWIEFIHGVFLVRITYLPVENCILYMLKELVTMIDDIVFSQAVIDDIVFSADSIQFIDFLLLLDLNVSTFQTFYTRASQILSSKLSSVPIVVDDAVFGTDIELYLDLDDIRYMCQMEDLSANCIMVYMRHLYDIIVSRGMQDMYMFVNPTFISSESHENISDAITERLQTTQCQWIFIPFNTERHWILVVINLRIMRCYWLDPSGLPDQYNIKPLINVGLKGLQVDGKRRSNPIWCTITCPKQLINIESGIYVLRYMREIIDDIPNLLTKKKPFTKLTYNQDEIDAVRLEWIHFVEKHL